MSDQPNVYIFNKIKNNEADVNLLTKTFQSLDCLVKQIDDVPLSDLQKEVEKMCSADLNRYTYIVIVILDNTNKNRNIWETSDNEKFFLNGDLLNKLKLNKTLENKLVLSIFQNNSTCDPCFVSRKKIEYSTGYGFTDVRFHALEPDKMLDHQWKGFRTSTFIRVICEVIGDSKNNNKPIEKILSLVAEKVSAETESKELPVTEVAQTKYLSKAFLGSALCNN